jgi:hypothetical protein
VTREEVAAELVALRIEFSRRVDALLTKLATRTPAIPDASEGPGDRIKRRPVSRSEDGPHEGEV